MSWKRRPTRREFRQRFAAFSLAGVMSAALPAPAWPTDSGNVNGPAQPFMEQLNECFHREDEVLELLAQLPEDEPIPAGSSAAVGSALATARNCLAELRDATLPGVVPQDVFLAQSATPFAKDLEKALRHDNGALEQFADGRNVKAIRKPLESARLKKLEAKGHLQGINVTTRKLAELVPPDRYEVPGEVPFANAYHASASLGKNPLKTFAWVIDQSINATVTGKTVRLSNDQPVARGGDERVAIWNFRAKKPNDPPGSIAYQYARTLAPPFDLATTMGGYTCPKIGICAQKDGTRVCYSYARVDVTGEFYTVCVIPRDEPPRVQVFDFSGVTGGEVTVHNNGTVPNTLVVDLFTQFNGDAFLTSVQPRDAPASRVTLSAAPVPTTPWTRATIAIGAAGLTGKFQVGAEAVTVFTHPPVTP